MRLQNRVALVTGAASGIGKEIARTFVREGAKVAIADLDQAGADATAAELGGPERRAIGITMDVTAEEQVETGVTKAVNTFGRLDVLVSNAGIQIVAPTGSNSPSPSGSGCSRSISTAPSLPRARRCARCTSRTVAAASSTWVRCIPRKPRCSRRPTSPPSTGSSASPRTVAKEGAKHDVRANVICPGFVRTPLVDKQIPEQAKELGISEQEVVKNIMLKDTVDGEFTTVEDVAEAALFFAAFESNALTGQSLVVSHGWFIQ